MVSTENETNIHMDNDTISNITVILSLIESLNTTIHGSFLFKFIDDYKDNYLEDFTGRLSFDLVRKLGHFER